MWWTETYLVGGCAHVEVPDLPRQRKQYFRAPNTHCSTVHAARARLSVVGWVQDILSLLQVHGQSPPSQALEQCRVALTRLSPCLGDHGLKRQTSLCPPSHLPALGLLGEPTRVCSAGPHLLPSPRRGVAALHVLNLGNTPKHELLLHPFGVNEGGGRSATWEWRKSLWVEGSPPCPAPWWERSTMFASQD